MNLADQIATAVVPAPAVVGLLRDRFLAALANGRGEILDAAALALGAAEDAGLTWLPKGNV